MNAITEPRRPQPLPEPPPIEAPRDVPFPGQIVLRVDATDIQRGIFRVHETLPVQGQERVTLLYPKWLPGYHSPAASIELLAGLRTRAGGQELAWKRDPVEVHAFHIELPAGAIAPGLSNLFITVAIREAGASRASVAFGVAPLFAVTLAVLVFGERPAAAVLVGALLIVAGGVALALEPERPLHVRTIGIAYALAGAALFALRDNLVRELSLDTDVPSMTAGAAMLAASLVVTSAFVVGRRNRVVWPP